MPFSAKSLDFLFENRLNDRKEWFEAHKEDFRTLVLQPLQQLVVDLTPAALEIDSRFVVEPRTDRTISRIRRDTRFSKDKSLYRDYMWIHFDRGKSGIPDQPCVWFDMSGRGFGYGCGIYAPSPGYMDTMREMILAGDPLFLKAKKALEEQNVFYLDGNRYKRPRYPEQPEDLQQWLDLKDVGFSYESKDFDLLFSDKLAESIAKDLLLLKPLYQFLFHVAESRAAGSTPAEPVFRSAVPKEWEW